MATERETLFYVRTEDEKGIAHVRKNVLWIWWILGVGGVLFFVATVFPLATVLLLMWGAIFLGHCVFSAATCAGASSEIKGATAKGFVKVSGSECSSSNPLAVVIDKSQT